MRKIVSLLLLVTILSTSTIAAFASGDEASVPENGTMEFSEDTGRPEAIYIEGEWYKLKPAPAPIETRAPMYDWKVGPTYKYSLLGQILVKSAISTALGALLGIKAVGSAAAQLAKAAVTYFVNKDKANLYYTKYTYYALNVTGYGGYPYYCKVLIYQYADKNRTIDISGGGPAIEYFYAYQPY